VGQPVASSAMATKEQPAATAEKPEKAPVAVKVEVAAADSGGAKSAASSSSSKNGGGGGNKSGSGGSGGSNGNGASRKSVASVKQEAFDASLILGSALEYVADAKPGQKKPTPSRGSGIRVFYETLVSFSLSGLCCQVGLVRKGCAKGACCHFDALVLLQLIATAAGARAAGAGAAGAAAAAIAAPSGASGAGAVATPLSSSLFGLACCTTPPFAPCVLS
jgi:hypothetical protein